MKKMIFKPVTIIAANKPKDNDIVIVSQCPKYKDNYDIVGYEIDHDGALQSFNKRHFAEPQTNKLSKELAANVIWREMIEHPALQEIEINPIVFNTNANF